MMDSNPASNRVTGTPTTPEPLQAPLATALERVRELEAAQLALLHGISHDLRAPLRHVTSYVPLIREALQAIPEPLPQPDGQKRAQEIQQALDWLKSLEHSARHMARMMDGLQAIARAVSAPLHLQAVALAAALHKARQAAIAAAGHAPHVQRTRWCLPAELERLPALRADAALLHQLLQQVLDNALKFTRQRTCPLIAIQAKVQTASTTDNTVQRLCITIEDNGAGFDGTRAQQLFGVFQRMHRASAFKGVGAGLALCQTIAQRHAANISVQASVDTGCRVDLDWPIYCP